MHHYVLYTIIFLLGTFFGQRVIAAVKGLVAKA